MLSVDVYDFDKVITNGVYPSNRDVIVTGRSYEEYSYVYEYLKRNHIPLIPIYFNPIELKYRETDNDNARIRSAYHKVSIVKLLLANRVPIRNFYEDEPIQYAIIKANLPQVECVLVDEQFLKEYHDR